MALAAAEMATMGGGAMMGELGRARRRRRRREWRGRGGGEEALSGDDATKTHALSLFLVHQQAESRRVRCFDRVILIGEKRSRNDDPSASVSKPPVDGSSSLPGDLDPPYRSVQRRPKVLSPRPMDGFLGATAASPSSPTQAARPSRDADPVADAPDRPFVGTPRRPGRAQKRDAARRRTRRDRATARPPASTLSP